eukprot:3722071-Lingulodinium_polyedra.AAC.1
MQGAAGRRTAVSEPPPVPPPLQYQQWLRQWAQNTAGLQGVFRRETGTPAEQKVAADVLKETVGVAPVGVTAELA